MECNKSNVLLRIEIFLNRELVISHSLLMGPGGTALVIISSNDAKTEKFTISEISHVASVCVRPRKNTGFIKKNYTRS